MTVGELRASRKRGAAGSRDGHDRPRPLMVQVISDEYLVGWTGAT